MTRSMFSKNCSAAAEVIGALLLVVIAIGAFAAIYFRLLPVPLPSPEPHVQLAGYVTDDGTVVIEHMGGEELNSYEIYVEQSDGPHKYRFENDPWTIGECYYPPINNSLFNEEKEVKVTVYSILKDGSTKIVFDGILTPEEHQPGPDIPPLSDPMFISTLRTNTVDEDLICFSHTIQPTINPKTFIYNWMVATTGAYTPFTRLLMPFDSQNPFQTKDYSGNKNNGTITGATWTDAGKLGGAYSYDGNDFIAIPYCFADSYLNTITVEAWVKTSLSSGTIVSYDRNKYYELAIKDGHVKWSTNSNNGAIDVLGNTLVNDNAWHLLDVTYQSSSGDSSIYVDGSLDIYQHSHPEGSALGIGDTPNGAIGKSTGAPERETIFNTSFETIGEKNNWKEDNETWGGGGTLQWQIVSYDSFESGWEAAAWNDGDEGAGGGSNDCNIESANAHQGTHSVRLRDNSEPPNNIYPDTSTYSDRIYAVTQGYTQMSVDFWWKADSMENGEDFWVRYYDGSNFYTFKTLVITTGQYSNNVFYHTVCYLNSTQYTFTNQMRFVIQCDASDNDDYIYIDQIYVNATKGNRADYNFNLRDVAALNPHSGTYSLGGSGDFDPEYALFNRTGIDISGYHDVIVSVWYSYKDTEAEDFFGFYYKNGSQWTPFFVVADPQIGSGQYPWTRVEIHIPASIQTLIFQFKWMTSSASEYLAIDDLEITGLPLAGESNFTGLIDEVKIYDRVLSAEQIHQNYLCTKDGNATRSVLVSEEIHLDEYWKCLVTPNDGMYDDVTTESNILYIINYGGGG